MSGVGRALVAGPVWALALLFGYMSICLRADLAEAEPVAEWAAVVCAISALVLSRRWR